MMIDSHCHLDFDAFDNDRDDVVSAAHAEGVGTIINIGTDLSTSERSVALAERYDGVYATVGVHPHDARKLDRAGLDRLRQLSGHERVVGIGEIGLDFYRDLSPRDVQRRVFREQLDLAAETKLPVVIHSRESLGETIAIIREFAPRLTGGVFHCFPGTVEEAREVFDLGFVISVGGVITFKKAKMAREAAAVPLDRLILETDAPYLTPEPFRGKRNQPAYVKYVYQKLAELRQEDTAEVEKRVDRTCKKLFGLVDVFGG